MKKIFRTLGLFLLASCLCPASLFAGADQYVGDTAIYGGAPSGIQPNVLIIIDTSGSMADYVSTGTLNGIYNPATTYPIMSKCGSNNNDNCQTNKVYDVDYKALNYNVGSTATDCNHATPRATLTTYGVYIGPELKSDGTCKTSSTATKTYYSGNYLNWIFGPGGGLASKLDIAKRVINNFLGSTSGVSFGLMRFDNSGSNEGGRFMAETFSGGTYTTTIQNMDEPFSGNTSTTNRFALMAAVNQLSTSGATPLGEALFEGLRYFQGEESAFGNTIGLVSNPTGSTRKTYTSPIQWSCQQNFIIVVTDGEANQDDNSVLDSLCTHGDCDGDGAEPVAVTTTNHGVTTTTYKYNHIFDDIAKYLYENDLASAYSDSQSVSTYVIGFGLAGASQTAVDLMTRATNSLHGRGQYYEASGETQLALAFNDIIGNVTAVNSSFVAPVVPVSPENKIYSGERIYMGFFKPDKTATWSGNLKKYAIRTNLDGSKDVLDVNGAYATYVDNDNSHYDDRDGRFLTGGASNGAFREADDALHLPAAKSFWSSSPDGGDVEKGGVGDVLMQRAFTLDASGTINGAVRNIYTYLPATSTTTDLTNAKNAFSTANADLTASVLGLPGPNLSGGPADVKNLINYVHGFDVYSSNTPTNKRGWIMGDILHAKPVLVSYATYSFSAANESNCAVNKVMIYAGSNDGMLHAFNDCDGSEAWAFIPPDILPYLQYLQSLHHVNFADSTVSTYMYDANQDGNIDSAAGDKVILIFGLRRGGGASTVPTQGYYYALDVSNRFAPVFMWSISNSARRRGLNGPTVTADYNELGESWSEPKIVKVKAGDPVAQKVVAFIGAGYDNCNEDGRYGSTQAVTSPCPGLITTNDTAISTSTGTTAVSTLNGVGYKGRRVYAVEIAQLNASTGVPSFTDGGLKIWASGALSYAMPSELAAVDMNFDGYTDRLYAGDVGGNLWRFDVSATNTDNWTTTKLFSSNPGYTDGAADSPATNGRKIFYKPSAVIDTNNLVRLYFGTGDREHPLNRGVIDRFYEFIDKGDTVGTTTHTYPVNEGKLVDVTTDMIQATLSAGGQTAVDAIDQKLSNEGGTGDPQNTTYYGWYIQLDGQDRNPTVANPGEKVYAAPYVANSVVYFTTYSPNISTTPTATCGEGNRGIAYLYAVDYRTGMAVFNYDTTNDTSSNFTEYSWNRYTIPTANNPGASASSGEAVHVRTDRKMALGTGIASEPGEWIGREGSVEFHPETSSDQVIPVYWRQPPRSY